MVEKFSDFEGTKYLNKSGTFEFEVMSAELKDSKSGNPMAVFDVKSDAGSTALYFSLNEKARWKYNNFITACLNLTEEQKKTLELDYSIFHNNLIGKKFIGLSEEDSYDKEVKKLLDDGTFETVVETKISYKITDFFPAGK